jgi:hypothetical protein
MLLIALVVAVACMSFLTACGPSTRAAGASAKQQTTVKTAPVTSAAVIVHRVSTAEAAAEAAAPAILVKTIAAMPQATRIDIDRMSPFPARYGYLKSYLKSSIKTHKPKPNGFRGLGHDHFARADV